MQRTLTCLAVLATVSIGTAQHPFIGVWHFDEQSGLTAADSGPNGNHGTLVNFSNDPAQWITGMHGNALALDGTDDYVDVARNAGLPFYTGFGAAFSVCFWVQGPAQDDRRVVSLGSSASNTPLWGLGTGQTSQGKGHLLRLYARNAEGVSSERYSEATVFDGNWHHVAYVETAGSARLYVDGVRDTGYWDDRHSNRGSRSHLHGTYPFDIVALGAVVRPSICCYFQGAIDDLQIYGFELSPTDVVSVMNGNLATTCRAGIGEYGVGCGPGPFELDVTGSAQLGAMLAFSMRSGQPNAAAVLCAGVGQPSPIDLTPFGLPGCHLYPAQAACSGVGALNAYGGSSQLLPLPIPNAAGLACTIVSFQAAALSASGAETTNAIIAVLGF